VKTIGKSKNLSVISLLWLIAWAKDAPRQTDFKPICATKN
jgi:hypothetical protein